MSEVILYNNDCIQAMAGIADRSINLILTDPPYNLGNFMISRDTNLKKMRDNFFGTAGWDNLEYDEWTKAMDGFFEQAARVMVKGGSMIVFMAAIKVETTISLAEKHGFYYKTTGIWHKLNPMPRNMNLHFVNSTETWIYFTYKTRTGTFNNNGTVLHDFIETSVTPASERKYADYDKVLFSWLGFDLDANAEKEKNIVRFLTAISESAYYKLADNQTDIVFNLESVYRAVLSQMDTVDISGDKEAKGSLRILKSALTENLVSNLTVHNNAVSAVDAESLRYYADRVSVFHQLEPKVYLTAPTAEPAIDFDALRQEWMGKDNQEFILGCLDFMKAHGLFTENSLEILQSKEQCATLFRHNSLNGILLCVNSEQAEDGQRRDANGNARYYSEKYLIGDNEYFVSSEWRPDREDARKPLIDWIFAMVQEIKFSTGYQSEFPRNRILFGAPGTGKSFTLNHEKDALLADGGEYERVTFHPDYSYANFVGTYKPVSCKDSDGKDAITYSYVPGPFMRTYVKALQNSRTDDIKPFLLIIEEINRANVAAVFGDVFQLLDRGDDEVSEYPIQASEDIKKYLVGELGGNPDDYSEIRIPDNMFIWATMNSADQGVFPMDTAFKRRWDFTYLGIDDSEAGIVGKKVILGQGDYCRCVEWNALRKAINRELLSYKVNEDKLMGPYFISKKNMPEGEMIDPAVFARIFKNKVIMYLFDDAAKQKRPTLFAGCEDKNKNLYSQICSEFDAKGVYIFCDNISSQFIYNVPEDDGE